MSFLNISVTRGVGSGPTRLAAFDSALQAAGVADLNLIRLSSVIPPGSTVSDLAGHPSTLGDQGDVLDCVYADAYASTPGEDAWAGVSWAMRTDGSGAGLFVEHSGASEATVRRDLQASLHAMSEKRADDYEVGGTTIASAHCVDHPVCAFVVAAYRVSPWNAGGLGGL